ncbi:peptide-methionine (S)-S-oxide reductase MsrA [Feifania hominis]|uniref:Peptide methionine sulfoxide reductase MsrA n=1 Tax=Feifania hominis TaxID=2763660 RepID=A0A926DBI7_9FIRM|nr:peptide-methionine (S)-S-oxide reductase MsrA [Feifania hominis]MBC8535945.1 peptide-methionine (S)-S-oxide reductase MsrA [Feifania hominis]
MTHKTLCLAGGCFWGVERFVQALPGILYTQAGYANGRTEWPTYEQVCSGETGHAEAVLVRFDAQTLTLKTLVELFFTIIDPTLRDRQGNDCGSQYRSGVYYADPGDLPVIEAVFARVRAQYERPLCTELAPLTHFWPAEEYHQSYLQKNPGGYCHIPPGRFQQAWRMLVDPALYPMPPLELLRETMDPLAFRVAFESETEPAYSNVYWDRFEPGLYVDVASGEPLFSSADKFRSPCGWPAFSKPIDPAVISEHRDTSFGMERVEVRARVSGIHLGHVFEDGPAQRGGRRYCINGVCLRFVPLAQMEREGYGGLIGEVE